MSRKIQSTTHLHGDELRCSMHKMKELKTFSNFVDKVIGNLSFPFPPCPRVHQDSDNPIEVLGNKGLLNISQNTVKPGSCSTIDVSFYTEESQRGETDRIFSSNHQFRNGKLVYTVTQEMIPESIEQNIEKLDHRLRAKCPGAISNITKRNQRFSKSATYTSDGHLAKLEALPSCVKPSPERYFYNARTTYSHSKSPIKKRNIVRSSSEISISSKGTRIYLSPEKTVRHSSTHEVNYRKMSISPVKPKIKNDLFVIPSHSCSKVRPGKAAFSTSEILQWDKVCRFIRSPGFKSYVEQQKVEPSLEKQHCHHISYRTSKTPNSESEYRHIKYSTRMNNGVLGKSLSHHNHMMSHKKTSPRKVKYHSTENRHPSRISEQVVYSTICIPPDKAQMCSKRSFESCNYEKYRFGKPQASHTRRNRYRGKFVNPRHEVLHGTPEAMPAGEPLGHVVASHKRIGDEYDARTNSEKSSRSHQSSSTISSESEKPHKKRTHKHTKTFTKPKTRKEAKYYKQKIQRDHSSGENNGETKKCMNLNKSVHFKNNDRCQYYFSDETSKDVDEIFGSDRNSYLENKPSNNRYRQNSNMKCYGKIHKRNKDYQEVTYAKDTIGNSNRIEDNNELDIMENFVNESALQEYRENFADVTRKTRTENTIKKKETVENNKYNLNVSVDTHTYRVVKRHHQEECEACRIERLLED